MAVRNWQWHGFVGGMVLYNEGFVTPERFEYYVHHPPLSAYLAAPLVLLTGFDEALIRFPSAACTLISTAALYVLVRRLYDIRRARWAALLYAVMPMVAYFGRMPNYEPPGLMFTLLFAAVLVQWIKAPNRARWLALAVLVVGVVWSAWAADIITALLGLVTLLAVAPRQRAAVVGLGVVGAAALLGMLALFIASKPDTLETLQNQFLYRTSDAAFARGSEAFTWGEYLLRQIARGITLFTPTVLVLAALGIPAVVRDRRGRWIVLALSVGGLTYNLIFRNGSFVHDFYAIYVAPAVAIFAASGVTRCYRSRWIRPLVAALLIMTPAPSLVYLASLHASADGDDVLRLAALVQENSPSDALILSNFPDSGWALGFYAERSVDWLISPDAAIAQAAASGVPIYYLYCDFYSRLPPTAPVIRQAPYNDDCRLAELSTPNAQITDSASPG